MRAWIQGGIAFWNRGQICLFRWLNAYPILPLFFLLLIYGQCYQRNLDPLGVKLALFIPLVLLLFYIDERKRRWRLLAVYAFGLSYFFGHLFWGLALASNYCRQLDADESLRHYRISKVRSQSEAGRPVEAFGEDLSAPGVRIRIQFFPLADEAFTPIVVGTQFSTHKKAHAISYEDSVHAFDAPAYYASQACYLELKIKQQDCLDYQAGAGRSFEDWVYRMRGRVDLRLKSWLSEGARTLLRASLLADRSGFEASRKRAYRAAGLAHIPVASGQHLHFYMFLLGFLLERSRFSFRLRQFLKILFAGFFWGLSLGSLSLLRALSYFLVQTLYAIAKRPRDRIKVFETALVIIFLYRPLAFLELGFILSLVASFSILLCLRFWQDYQARNYSLAPLHHGFQSAFLLRHPLARKRLAKWGYRFLKAFSLAFLVDFSLHPFLMHLCERISCLSVFYNLIAAIYFSVFNSLAILILALCYLPFSRLLLLPLSQSLEAIASGLDHLAGSALDPRRDVFLRSHQEVFWVQVLVLLIVLSLRRIWLSPKSWPRRLRQELIFLLLLLIPFQLYQFWMTPFLRLSFVSCGTGDAAHFQFRNGLTFMIDAGKEVNAERYLGRFLDARSTLPPSFLIISHLHEDHYGGAFYLMSKQGLSALYVRAPTAQSLAIEDTSSAYRRLQEEAALHDVQFIDPDEYPELNLPGGFRLISLELEAAPEADENGRSLFQRLEAGETRLLFTGDLGAVDEERLLRKLGPEAISCEILKVPHHGSKHSSTEEFIEASGAEIAVICVGKNRYGHPSQEVIARLETAGMEVFRTDLDGDVCLDFDRRGRYRIQRSVGRRFRSFLEAFDWHFRSRRPLRSAHG